MGREPSAAEREALANLMEAQKAYDDAWRALVQLQEESSRRPGRPDPRVPEAQARIAEEGRRLRLAGRLLRDARSAARLKAPKVRKD